MAIEEALRGLQIWWERIYPSRLFTEADVNYFRECKNTIDSYCRRKINEQEKGIGDE